MKSLALIILSGFLVLAGCATLSKDECLRGDWRALGVTDGVKGEPATRIEEHRKACAEHSIRIDEKLYMDGRAEGLRQYCQIDNAFQTGLKGRKYHGVCPPAIHPHFARCNSAAYAVYETRKDIENVHSSISSKQSRLESKKTSAKDRIHIRGEIHELESKLDDLRNKLHNRERRLDNMMVEAKEWERGRKRDVFTQPGPAGGPVLDWSAESVLEEIEALMLQNRWKDAQAALDRAVQKYPGYPPLEGAYCRIYWMGFGNREKTLQHAQRLRNKSPDYEAGYYWEARVREKEGDYKKCLAVLAACPCYESRFARNSLTATCQYNLGRLQESLDALPTRSEAGDSWDDLYGGWHAFLQGQIVKRDFYRQHQKALGKAAASADARIRSLTLVKLAILGIPDAVSLIGQASRGTKGELAAAAGKLRDLLRAKRKLYQPKPAPLVPPGAGPADASDDVPQVLRKFYEQKVAEMMPSMSARPVPAPEALTQLFRELDAIPSGGKLPPISGRYMMREMLQTARQHPEYAKPLSIEVNPARDRYNMGAGWVKADGRIGATSKPTPTFHTAAADGDALLLFSVNADPEVVSVVVTSIRGKGRDLVQISRNWVDAGEVFYFTETKTESVRVEP